MSIAKEESAALLYPNYSLCTRFRARGSCAPTEIRFYLFHNCILTNAYINNFNFSLIQKNKRSYCHWRTHKFFSITINLQLLPIKFHIITTSNKENNKKELLKAPKWLPNTVIIAPCFVNPIPIPTSTSGNINIMCNLYRHTNK